MDRPHRRKKRAQSAEDVAQSCWEWRFFVSHSSIALTCRATAPTALWKHGERVAAADAPGSSEGSRTIGPNRPVIIELSETLQSASGQQATPIARKIDCRVRASSPEGIRVDRRDHERPFHCRRGDKAER
jgi:hypothetical protein